MSKPGVNVFAADLRVKQESADLGGLLQFQSVNLKIPKFTRILRIG